MDIFVSFIKDESGLTAIEYVIAASLLVGALITLFSGFGDTLNGKLTATLAKIT